MKTRALIFFLVGSLITGCKLHHDKLITTFGAVADGITNNATFIQKAIDEISATGGGQLVVPAGNFMTSTIYLKSGVDLHLVLGARLLGPTNRNDYCLLYTSDAADDL